MEKIIEAIARTRARHEKELAELDAQETIAKAVLPAIAKAIGDYPAKIISLHMHVTNAAAVVGLDCDNLNAAMVVAERLNPLPIFRCKDNCLSFEPEGSKREKAVTKQGGDVASIGPWIYVLDGLRQYPEHKTLMFWVEIAGYVVKLEAKIKNDPDTQRKWRTRTIQGGYVVEDQQFVTKDGRWLSYDRFASGSPDQPSRVVAWEG